MHGPFRYHHRSGSIPSISSAEVKLFELVNRIQYYVDPQLILLWHLLSLLFVFILVCHFLTCGLAMVGSYNGWLTRMADASLFDKYVMG